MHPLAVRQPLVDLLKALAAQCIVLHHFSAYGPLSDAARVVLPHLFDGLYDYGRMAVQVFLVVAGYLAARSLTQPALAHRSLVSILAERYIRLIGPFVAALALAVLCAAVARPWLSDEFVPASPSWRQLLAHAGLLHGVLGVDALSAGVWYVAIDFQLFSVLAALFWLGRGDSRVAPVLVAGLCVASLLVFNRDAGLDNWAVYFFGAYGMGVLAWWARRREPAQTQTGWLSGLMVALALVALGLEFRWRIALALGTALLLAKWGNFQSPALPKPFFATGLQHLSETSYALFLIHFPVLMLCNALFAASGLTGSGAALGFIASGCIASVWLAGHFYRQVELPLGRWRRVMGVRVNR